MAATTTAKYDFNIMLAPIPKQPLVTVPKQGVLIKQPQRYRAAFHHKEWTMPAAAENESLAPCSARRLQIMIGARLPEPVCRWVEIIR